MTSFDGDVLPEAFDALPASVVVLDEQGDVVETNEQWRESFGPLRGERSYLDALDSVCEETASVREGLGAVVDGDAESFTELCRCEMDEEDRWFLVRGVSFSVDSERYLLVPHVDVTQLCEQELSVRERMRQLEAALSMVVHDVRNPLNVASGYADLLSEESNSAFAKRVQTGLARIETVIDDAMLLARGDVGDLEPVALREKVESVWNRLEPEEGELVVERSFRFEASPDLIDHVFENLLANAVCHADGDVTIRVGPLTDPPGFYVADDGPGIPEEERDHVFEPGYTTSQEGYGLGLVVVQHIVRAHGWEIDLTESEAGGARFEVTGVDAVE